MVNRNHNIGAYALIQRGRDEQPEINDNPLMFNRTRTYIGGQSIRKDEHNLKE